MTDNSLKITEVTNKGYYYELDNNVRSTWDGGLINTNIALGVVTINFNKDIKVKSDVSTIFFNLVGQFSTPDSPIYCARWIESSFSSINNSLYVGKNFVQLKNLYYLDSNTHTCQTNLVDIHTNIVLPIDGENISNVAPSFLWNAIEGTDGSSLDVTSIPRDWYITTIGSTKVVAIGDIYVNHNKVLIDLKTIQGLVPNKKYILDFKSGSITDKFGNNVTPSTYEFITGSL